MLYDFEEFKKKSIVEGIGLDKYLYLVNRLHECVVSEDQEYQTCFNTFYRVRRDKKWRNAFYSYFQKAKERKDIEFDEIIDYMYCNPKIHNVEASFCSKMLATINPKMPIIDQFILKELGLEIKGSKTEKLENAKRVYKEIIIKEKELLNKEDIKQLIKSFKLYFKEYDISDIKILDFILWRRGKEKSNIDRKLYKKRVKVILNDGKEYSGIFEQDVEDERKILIGLVEIKYADIKVIKEDE